MARKKVILMSASRRKSQHPHRSLMPKRPLLTREDIILRTKKAAWAAVLKECYEQRQRILHLLVINNAERSTLQAYHDKKKESLVKMEDHHSLEYAEEEETCGGGVEPPLPAHHPSPLNEELLETGKVEEQPPVMQ